MRWKYIKKKIIIHKIKKNHVYIFVSKYFFQKLTKLKAQLLYEKFFFFKLYCYEVATKLWKYAEDNEFVKYIIKYIIRMIKFYKIIML